MPKSLGIKLKELRAKKGVTLEVVANAVNTHKSHVWKIEKKIIKSPSIKLLMKFANYFCVSVDYLAGYITYPRKMKPMNDSDVYTLFLVIDCNKQDNLGHEITFFKLKGDYRYFDDSKFTNNDDLIVDLRKERNEQLEILMYNKNDIPLHKELFEPPKEWDYFVTCTVE
jgi:transcriptional regulator with XRE-family HTH domain